jgi:cytochrome P450
MKNYSGPIYVTFSKLASYPSRSVCLLQSIRKQGKYIHQIGTKPARPKGILRNSYQTWLLVNYPQSYTTKLRKQFGDIVALYGSGGDAFVIALTSAGAQQILTANPDAFDAFWKEGFAGAAGKGSIWVLEPQEHQRERKLLSPAFHAQSFRRYGEVIRDITIQKITGWKPGQTLRALDTTLDISLDVIMRVVFGVTDPKFILEGRKVLKPLRSTLHPSFIFFPKMQNGWFPIWVRYARAREDFSNWVHHYLMERRGGSQNTDDLIGSMLTAQYTDGSPMSDEDIRDELLTILLAGHETTATALSWVLYDLGSNPDKLVKLRGELEALGPAPEAELIAKAPYLSAVCNESQRLHTLLPEVGRTLVLPFELAGYTLQPGDSVGVSVMAIHHDPELYPEPSHFIPERFINHTYTPFEYLPFGGGHRRCLGSGLSDFEMRIALAEIVTSWDFESAAVEHEVRHDISMGSRHGVRLRINSQRVPLSREILPKAG